MPDQEMMEGRRACETATVNTFTPMKAQEDTIDLLELMYRLLAKWKMILCLALVGTLLAGVYTFALVTPMYRATSTIYVLSRRDSAINMADLQIGTALTKDYVKVFKMWEVHEQVRANLGLDYDYNQMRSMLSVTNDADTRMLDIAVSSSDPQEAAAMANEYANVASQYIADTMSTDKPNIVSVALVPSNPVSPNATKNLMLGFLLGALIAAGIVTVRMLLDDTYKTAEDIRRYAGLVNLATIPIDEENDRKTRKGGSRV